jgi:hypothetical protein
MKTILRYILFAALFPLWLPCAVLWGLLLWNNEDCGQGLTWESFKVVFFPPKKPLPGNCADDVKKLP